MRPADPETDMLTTQQPRLQELLHSLLQNVAKTRLQQSWNIFPEPHQEYSRYRTWGPKMSKEGPRPFGECMTYTLRWPCACALLSVPQKSLLICSLFVRFHWSPSYAISSLWVLELWWTWAWGSAGPPCLWCPRPPSMEGSEPRALGTQGHKLRRAGLPSCEAPRAEELQLIFFSISKCAKPY
jgi:hypothetical protein